MNELLNDKRFWFVLLGILFIIVLLVTLFPSTSPTIEEAVNPKPGDGCPNSRGVDNYGNPCPTAGLDCPSASGLDRFGNPCPTTVPSAPTSGCNPNQCNPNRQGYDMCGNWSFACAGTTPSNANCDPFVCDPNRKGYDMCGNLYAPCK